MTIPFDKAIIMNVYHYTTWIKESTLDSFGHVNNAAYLTLLEEARWELLTQNNYGIDKIRALGIGPVLLEIKLSFLKELYVRDVIEIKTQLGEYKRKIGYMTQEMLRGDDVCYRAELTIGMLDLKARKLITPSADWLASIGYE